MAGGRFHLTDDERYRFDLQGYLVVPGALGVTEVDACNRAIDAVAGTPAAAEGMLGWPEPHREPFRRLLIHPDVVARLNELCGPRFRLDHGPRLLAVGDRTGAELQGGGEPFSPAAWYHQQNGRIFTSAVTAAWQVAGEGGVCVVPGSHKAVERAPAGVRAGGDRDAAMDVVRELPTRVGDLAHPAVAMRLNAMCQPGFRLDHGPLLIAGVKGTEGFTLHGEGEPFRPSVGYRGRNGESYCAGVTVQWQLRDVAAGDGGFACVPGSHKSRYPKPDGVRTADDHRGTVVQPAMRAGDVLFFMDGALTHGTLPWRGAGERRSILFKYASRCAVRQWPDPAQAEPESFWDPAFVDGMTPEQRAVMHGPNSGHAASVPELTVDPDGTVRAGQV